VFRGRAITLAAVLLVSAPPAAANPSPAKPAPAEYAEVSVVRTVTWRSWSAGPDGTYRATTYRRPYVFEVPYVIRSLSASSRASASRR
jgi:ABC-type glycerol-3-phosphate transport system substrate-binding protein